ncbi:VOC family protein [Streptomyces sp. NPDC051162]|uniref:VOC family protein n=1 Tax=Streptomyces sp. NPDC051162 TaxID=3154747 RepID=UPI00343CD2AC
MVIAKLLSTVIDCPDPVVLGTFYAGILGGRLDAEDPEWVELYAPDGRRFSFQRVADHRPPRWPDPEHPQQFHLDFVVDTVEDVEVAQRAVEALGAVFLHDSGGRTRGFRVFRDPAGHPFCLCYGQPVVTF